MIHIWSSGRVIGNKYINTLRDGTHAGPVVYDLECQVSKKNLKSMMFHSDVIS